MGPRKAGARAPHFASQPEAHKSSKPCCRTRDLCLETAYGDANEPSLVEPSVASSDLQLGQQTSSHLHRPKDQVAKVAVLCRKEINKTH